MKKFTPNLKWFFRLFDYDRSRAVFNAKRDWLIILAGTAIAIFLLSFLSYWLYFYLQTDELKEPPAPKLIDLKKLEETVGIFEAKAGLFQKYFQNPPRLSDPY